MNTEEEDKVLGIDPGLARVGLALVNKKGELLKVHTIKLGAKMDPNERIKAAISELGDFLVEHIITDVTLGFIGGFQAVMEAYATYGLKGSITNAFHMGRLIQALLDVIGIVDFPGHEVELISARRARKFVTGNPTAKGSQIREGLRLLGYDQRMNEHERDALALALCWLEEESGNN